MPTRDPDAMLMIICPSHSTKGVPLKAETKLLGEHMILVFCPKCLELGNALRRKGEEWMLARREREGLLPPTVEEKAAGKHGLAPSPEVKPEGEGKTGLHLVE